MQKDVILLVDENPEDALLLQLALKEAGVENPVEVLTHAEDAIRYFEGAGCYSDRQAFPIPVLTVIELRTPLREDFKPLRQIREHAEFNAIPIVVLCGLDIEAERQAAYQFGANWFRIKPRSFPEFVDLCHEINQRWLNAAHRAAA